MIQNSDLLLEFEKRRLESAPFDYFTNLRIFEALYQEARRFHILPLRDPLEGIDVDIRIAKCVNVRRPA
ncbi:MAG: hypothetical protein A2V65_10365 [Deltaproteobacteria bacterium RBG_13_49_15]|nr:MAG: hypothetical protein A2V65_10365 [Deltaproteobacteria bacterium RBG_13_49_15]